MEVERLLSKREVAALFGIGQSSVDRYERAGAVPPRRRMSGGRCGWLLSECVQAMRALPVGTLAERTAVAREALAASRKGEAA